MPNIKSEIAISIPQIVAKLLFAPSIMPKKKAIGAIAHGLDIAINPTEIPMYPSCGIARDITLHEIPLVLPQYTIIPKIPANTPEITIAKI
jgi:hypothetical protein